jgi:hypothetical protein
MRKTTLAVVIVGLLAGFVPVGSARAREDLRDSKTYYTGRTAQGLDLFFDVVHTGNGDLFEPFFTNFLVTCPKTGDQFAVEYIFIGFAIPIENGHFDVKIPDLQVPFDWKGRVGPRRALGDQSFGFAAYDGTGSLQDCGTGPIGWHAAALHRGDGSLGSLGSHLPGTKVNAVYQVTLAKDPQGHVLETITVSR